jgi:hypothetical protein
MGNVTSFVLYPEDREKLELLAKQLGVNRSVVVRLLIQGAEVVSLPELKITPLVIKANDN